MVGRQQLAQIVDALRWWLDNRVEFADCDLSLDCHFRLMDHRLSQSLSLLFSFLFGFFFLMSGFLLLSFDPRRQSPLSGESGEW